MSRKRMRDVLSGSLIESGEFRYLTVDETKELQLHLLAALKDINNFSEKEGIEIFAVGGTLLGAVRHKGFIPWDDDLDLGIKREDYNHFLKKFEKEFDGKYFITAPNYKDGSQVFYCRIYIRGIAKTVPSNTELDYPKNVFLDLFIVDYAPNNKLLRNIKGFYINTLRFIGSSVFRYTYNSKKARERYTQNLKAKMIYQLRITIGFIFSFMSYKKWFNLFDKLSIGKQSNYVTIPSGRKFYHGEIVSSEVFGEARALKFEDTNILAPVGYEKYLENLYGDYMVIPSKEEREKHLIKELNI